MQLRLAEYNLETGKFERFLELGKDFGYFGNYIRVVDKWEMSQPKEGGYTDCPTKAFCLDEKDPLNRFNDLFDGRTYGEGRFVLISNSQRDEDIFEDDVFKDHSCRPNAKIIIWEHWINQDDCTYFSIGKRLGNLHENPELWDKLK